MTGRIGGLRMFKKDVETRNYYRGLINEHTSGKLWLKMQYTCRPPPDRDLGGLTFPNIF